MDSEVFLCVCVSSWPWRFLKHDSVIDSILSLSLSYMLRHKHTHTHIHTLLQGSTKGHFCYLNVAREKVGGKTVQSIIQTPSDDIFNIKYCVCV